MTAKNRWCTQYGSIFADFVARKDVCQLKMSHCYEYAQHWAQHSQLGSQCSSKQAPKCSKCLFVILSISWIRIFNSISLTISDKMIQVCKSNKSVGFWKGPNTSFKMKLVPDSRLLVNLGTLSDYTGKNLRDPQSDKAATSPSFGEQFKDKKQQASRHICSNCFTSSN